MERFEQIFTRICDFLALYICGFLLLAMVTYVSGNVFFRYALGLGGLDGTYTYVGKMLIPLAYLGLAYAWYKKAYIVVDVLTTKLSGKVLWGVQFAFLLITLVLFTAILARGTLMETISSYVLHKTAGEPPIFTPEWPWKASIFVGFFLLAIRNILDLITMVKTGKVIPEKR